MSPRAGRPLTPCTSLASDSAAELDARRLAAGAHRRAGSAARGSRGTRPSAGRRRARRRRPAHSPSPPGTSRPRTSCSTQVARRAVGTVEAGARRLAVVCRALDADVARRRRAPPWPAVSTAPPARSRRRRPRPRSFRRGRSARWRCRARRRGRRTWQSGSGGDVCVTVPQASSRRRRWSPSSTAPAPRRTTSRRAAARAESASLLSGVAPGSRPEEVALPKSSTDVAGAAAMPVAHRTACTAWRPWWCSPTAAVGA